MRAYDEGGLKWGGVELRGFIRGGHCKGPDTFRAQRKVSADQVTEIRQCTVSPLGPPGGGEKRLSGQVWRRRNVQKADRGGVQVCLCARGGGRTVVFAKNKSKLDEKN